MQRPRPTRAEIVDLLAGEDGVVHALTRRGALLTSKDGGRAWRSAQCQLGRPPRCLTRTASGRLLIGGSGGLVAEHAKSLEPGPSRR